MNGDSSLARLIVRETKRKGGGCHRFRAPPVTLVALVCENNGGGKAVLFRQAQGRIVTKTGETAEDIFRGVGISDVSKSFPVVKVDEEIPLSPEFSALLAAHIESLGEKPTAPQSLVRLFDDIVVEQLETARV